MLKHEAYKTSFFDLHYKCIRHAWSDKTKQKQCCIMEKQSLIHTEMKLQQTKPTCYQYKPLMQAYKTTRRGGDPLLFKTSKLPFHH